MCNVTGEDPDDPDRLVEELMQNARESMGKFVFEIPAAQETDDGDGI